MGFRFQKRLRIMPGLTLNLSKRGVSASIGTRGARVTYGHGQKRTTVGLPGSGLSYTATEKIASTKTRRTPKRRLLATEQARPPRPLQANEHESGLSLRTRILLAACVGIVAWIMLP
jgi:hypothetical protein